MGARRGFRYGTRVRILEGVAGIDSGRTGMVVPLQSDWRAEEGAYKPVPKGYVGVLLDPEPRRNRPAQYTTWAPKYLTVVPGQERRRRSLLGRTADRAARRAGRR
jgi:hypothetical protein